MRSMTGFGQASGDNGRYAVSVTLRGVNHRYLDLRLRIPDEARDSERELTELLSEELSRGRVECTVEVESLLEREVRVDVHRNVVVATHRALHPLMEEGWISGDLSARDLLQLPEAVSVRTEAGEWETQDRELLLAVGQEALGQMVEARRREGGALRQVLEERIASLRHAAGRLVELAGEAKAEMARGLEDRLERFLENKKVDLDPARLAQEVAVLADRSDVTEELDRLQSHLDHLEEILDREGAVGKRLDFLLQEVFRELNTLGSKCRFAPATRVVLDGKELAEQMREQVQNVE